MYNETVFQQIARLIENQTTYLGWIIFFLFSANVILLFISTRIRHLVTDVINVTAKIQAETHRQNEQILKQLECLKMATLSSYEAQYATAKALQIRADAVAEKRGEKADSVTPPSPAKVREILELWIDAKPPNAT
jgi:hypothetical protein